MAKTVETVSIPKINIKEFEITLIGDTPLIVHKFDEKTKREMLDKQMGKAKTKGHETKNPIRDFVESMYWIEGKPTEYTEESFYKAIENGAKLGFPSIAFKAAAATGGYRANVTKNAVTSYGAFHINEELVEIKGIPEMREDMVRVGMGSADIRFRGEFKQWSATFKVRYNTGMMNLEQIVNLFNLGGFTCGVGEWRPEKKGNHGMFHVG